MLDSLVLLEESPLVGLVLDIPLGPDFSILGLDPKVTHQSLSLLLSHFKILARPSLLILQPGIFLRLLELKISLKSLLVDHELGLHSLLLSLESHLLLVLSLHVVEKRSGSDVGVIDLKGVNPDAPSFDHLPNFKFDLSGDSSFLLDHVVHVVVGDLIPAESLGKLLEP